MLSKSVLGLKDRNEQQVQLKVLTLYYPSNYPYKQGLSQIPANRTSTKEDIRPSDIIFDYADVAQLVEQLIRNKLFAHQKTR